MSLREDPLIRAIRALRPDLRLAGFAVLAGATALGSAIGLMAVSAWLIARAAEQPPVMYLQVAVVATRTFGISRGVLRYLERLISHDVALRGVVELRTEVYTRLAEADPSAAAHLRRGDLLARVGADVDALADVLVRSVLPMLVSLVTALGAVILIAWMLPAAGLVLAIALALAGVAAPMLAAHSAAAAERDAAGLRSELSAQTLAVLEGTAELTVGAALPARLARVEALDGELTRTLDRAARPAAWAAGLEVLATGLAMVGCLALGLSATGAHHLSGVLLAVVALTPLAAAEAVVALPAAAIGLTRARAAAERVMALLDTPTAQPVAIGSKVPSPGITLTARAVSTAWACAPATTTGLELDLPPGRTVALVGPSGTGKTTALLTLAGLLPTRAGTVAIDGVSLTDLDPVALRRLVSYTAEDAHVFTTSVRENLRVARPDASDDALVAALERSGLGPWLARLPAGLDSVIGATQGPTAGLSGGERRRLLLARAFTGGAEVLLLDEPTEHLDEATADALIRDIVASGLSVVIVTHRLVGLEAFDEIITLAEGRATVAGAAQA